MELLTEAVYTNATGVTSIDRRLATGAGSIYESSNLFLSAMESRTLTLSRPLASLHPVMPLCQHQQFATHRRRTTFSASSLQSVNH